MQNPETKKTVIYMLVAGMALVVAWEPWRPLPPDNNAPPDVGTKVFPDFKDPLAAKSLEIMRFDEDTATMRPFKVAQINGVWSIPSHSNYPADAREHMAEAATALMDLEILSVASESAGDQELYGVITPDPQKLKQGMTGVGTRVTIKDGKDKALADLVIGKEVKDARESTKAPGQSLLRYVRHADRDQIYIVKIKTDKLSTKFEDWIEKDLLKLNAFDVRLAGLNDYSIEEGVSQTGGLGLRMKPRSQVKLAYDDAKSSWSLVELSEFDENGKPVIAKLADDEELDNEKLNALKTALDDLQIVDVERKPKGLSQDLRASEEFVKDQEAQASLVSRGFYPVPIKDQVEMFSSEGEATCTTKDGVRYVLRFGHLAGGVEDKDEPKEGEKPQSNPALNRYLFVMAQFDPSQIVKPELAPEDGKPADEKATDEKPAEAKPAEDNPAEPKEDVPQSKTGAQDAAEPAAAEAKSDAPQDAAAQADAKDSEKKPEAPASEEEIKKLTLQKENKRKQDEYNDAIKKGEDKVKELNDRFADWYFIISDDVYKKIHLGRADIIKKKAAKEAEGEKPEVLDLSNPK